MKHEQFETMVKQIYHYNYYGGEIVVFGKHKYDFEDEYEDFEIILSKDTDVLDGYDSILIDYDYHEGQDDYVLDGWCYLYDLLDKAHEERYYVI